MSGAGREGPGSPAILEPESLRYDASSGTVVLVGSRCTQCDRAFFPPRRRCAACAEESLVPHDLAARGRLQSFTRLHRTPRDAWVSAPYILGEVALPDGLVVYAHLVGAEWEDLEIGMDLVTVPFVIRSPDGGEVLAYAFGPAIDQAVVR